MAIVVVNFKTYKEATGEQAVSLAKSCEAVSKKKKAAIIVVVQNLDLFHVCREVSIPVYSQHIDPVDYGAHTGKDTAAALIDNGATGVLINHSEDSSGLTVIRQAIKEAQKVGLKTIVCAPDPKRSEELARFKPDFIAVEPPELIGGDVSVSKAKPDVIKESVKRVERVNKSVRVLCGAGIKNKEDVKIAVKLGCAGVLVASGVVKAKNPAKVIETLVV
jgi:triosephosphate isomerase